MNEKKLTILNISSNLVLQFISIANYFIIPRIILGTFGSEVNGLVSSVTQFLGYISLAEGGITGVISANLYKPLVERDSYKICVIVNTAKRFYKKIGILFTVYSLIIALLYSVINRTVFSFAYVFTIAIILAISLLIQYMLSLSFKTLLLSDKKVYLVSGVQSFILIINIILAYISVKIYPSVHLLKLLTGLTFFIQPLVFGIYSKKHYDLDLTEKCDNSLLKQRWDGFAVNIAAFIHNNTDIVILTFFTNLTTVSVYSVYALVTLGLRSIITAVSNAINPSVSQAYVGKKEEFEKKYAVYEYVIFIIVFIFFSVAWLLITPFVMLYTKNISNEEYFQPAFGYLLLLSEALYLIRFPQMNLSYAANKFKELRIPAYIEASINIIVSLALVKTYGLIGVAIGTLIAMLFRTIFHVWFLTKITNIKQWRFYKKIFVFISSSAIGLLVCDKTIPFSGCKITDFIFYGFAYTAIISLSAIAFNAVFLRREAKCFVELLLKGENK